MKFYTHLSDQFGPYHTNVIAATAHEAPHVLDGLLYHESSLVIDEHYTDTGGFSDHLFAVCRSLGFRYAPRIRDLNNLTGDYHWEVGPSMGPDQFRPLRATDFAMAA